jgi:hypothetical protein
MPFGHSRIALESTAEEASQIPKRVPAWTDLGRETALRPALKFLAPEPISRIRACHICEQPRALEGGSLEPGLPSSPHFCWRRYFPGMQGSRRFPRPSK